MRLLNIVLGRPIKFCRLDRALPMVVFRHCSVAPSLIFTTNQILSAPTCNIYGRFSALFRRPFINIYDQSNLVGTYVHYLWTFFGIVPSPLLYSPLDQSNLVVRTVYYLWKFSGNVRRCPFLHSVTSPIFSPLSSPFINIYDQSNLVGETVYYLWKFSGNVRHWEPTCMYLWTFYGIVDPYYL